MKAPENMTRKELIALVKQLQRGKWGAGVIDLYPVCPNCGIGHPPEWSCIRLPDGGWYIRFEP